MFVNKSVYGEDDGEAVSHLWRRYKDYNILDKLLKPYNLGDNWYTKAIEIIKADIASCDDWQIWRRRWCEKHVFKHNQIIFEALLAEREEAEVASR